MVVAFEHQAVDALARDDDELRQVDRIGALAQDRALRALLPAIGQEGRDVEEIGSGRIARQRLGGAERRAVAREDIADLALWDGDQRLGVHAILERHEEMIAAAQDDGLVAGFAAHGDQAGGNGAPAAPQFLDDGNAVVADIAHAAGDGEKHGDDEAHDGRSAEHI